MKWFDVITINEKQLAKTLEKLNQWTPWDRWQHVQTQLGKGRTYLIRRRIGKKLSERVGFLDDILNASGCVFFVEVKVPGEKLWSYDGSCMILERAKELIAERKSQDAEAKRRGFKYRISRVWQKKCVVGPRGV